VFTLLPLLTGDGRAHHGEILARATALVEAGKLRPLLNERVFSAGDIVEAYAAVEAGGLGKVVISL
jgi:NADPH:quinone reductase